VIVLLDIDKIQRLIRMMVENDLVEVSLRDGEEEVNLRRPGGTVVQQVAAPVAAPMLPPQALEAPPPAAASQPQTDDKEADLVTIDSPMVGTFYTASDPDSPALVTVGSSVSPGTLICIVEAMKVFNEIKAEVAGVIEKILVKNEQAVEFGQPLFAVRPS